MKPKRPTPYLARYLASARAAGPLAIASFCALVVCGVNACFLDKPTQVAGGGGVETTDGEVIASAGMLQGVRVRLVPQPFNPLASDSFPDSLTAFTDANGKYAFKGVPAGRYNLEAWQPKDGTRLLLPDMAIAPTGSHTLPKAGLARTGKLRLNWEGGHRGYLFVPGTTILHRILTGEIEAPALVIDSLPMGLLPPVFWSESKTDTAGTRITDCVPIQPDSIAEWNVFAAWAHHGTWHIDTSPAGAGVNGEVTSVPMLVRLASPDFDFSQAAPDGRDVRFSDPDGAELHYQVERWDAQAGRAEIWVCVPKVDGNSVLDFFRMHWGNAGADSHSSGPSVFGPANRFTAVFHLGEAGNTAAGGYPDATGSGRNGTGVALSAAATVPGAVGMGQGLNGSTQWIKVAGNFPTGTAKRSLSAWGKLADTTVSSELVAYGSASYLASFGEWNDQGLWTAWHWGPGNDMQTSKSPDTAWHQITLDYDGTITRFYMDGILAISGDRVLATTANGFTIGANYAGALPWPGIVDEVEMSGGSRSADWIKLAYENQRQGSKTLRLEILK